MEAPIVLNQKENLNFIQQNLEALTFSPGKEDLKNEIFNELKINTPIKMMMTSSAFMAELTQQQALSLKNHKHTVTVNEIQDTPPKISGTLITKDYENSGEFINWAKPYTQTDDNITTNNRLYYVDLGMEGYHKNIELNVTQHGHEGLQRGYLHSGFIAGLVGAKKNGLLTRGINPGQPLILATSNSYGGFIPFDVDRAAALAELSGDFGVLNVSMNPDIQGGMSSDFLKSFRRASNRFLITQSAGNNELYDVCNYSYGWLTSQGWTYQTNDAIIVVGGLNKQGGRMTQGYHHHPSDPSPGVVRSNWGACIEVDAPAENLKSLDPKGAGSLRVSSGTSYAAPIVAAIASRYGNMATRPITREHYITKYAQPTGHTDQPPNPGTPPRALKKVRYVPNPTGLPQLAPIQGAASPTNNHLIHFIKDGKFFRPGVEFWHASNNWGTLTVDLGSIKNLHGIRLTIETSAINNEDVGFSIFGAQSPMNLNPAQYESSKPTQFIRHFIAKHQSTRAPIYIPINGNYRSLRIDANNWGSWIAYAEIEVYET
ncbi:S8/S53 family peptidase [Vandammella animalimorsus]|uniref:S8/S53 family peptidase n=1 Tax=Vandammella animalimorsus TaxID=2029117 RepID=UPI0031BBA437